MAGADEPKTEEAIREGFTAFHFVVGSEAACCLNVWSYSSHPDPSEQGAAQYGRMPTCP